MASGPRKKPNQYLIGLFEHWRRKRQDKNYRGKRNTAVNDCWKPSNEASKADLAEYHAEEMKLRGRRQRRAA